MSIHSKGAKVVTLAMAAALVLAAFTGCAKKEAAQREFKIWHYESDTGAMGIAWAEAMKQFQAKHPDVKLVFETKGFEQIRQTAQMILNSDEAPDIMEYNKGNATAGMLSKQGLLTDLTKEASARGWDKTLSPSLQTTCRYSPEGVMGSGNWYGVTNYGEYVMVYYNVDMFKKADLAIPTTFADFEAACATFAKAGTTPIVLSGAEYPAQHVFYSLALSKADRSMINAYELYQGDFSFAGNPAFTYAADKMLDWLKKGYISKDAVSMKAEDMGVAWENGKSPIMISGSWWYGRLVSEVKSFEWTISLFPGNKMSPGSSGNIWVVPEKSKNKDLAYDFIDITLQPDIQALLGNSGGIPVNADLAKITDPKIKELIETFNKLNAEDGIAFYPDWPAAGFYDILVSKIQDLLIGNDTTEQFLASLDKSYKEGK